nr:hypothetical protein [Mycobacterium lepromatosis]
MSSDSSVSAGSVITEVVISPVGTITQDYSWGAKFSAQIPSNGHPGRSSPSLAIAITASVL